MIAHILYLFCQVSVSCQIVVQTEFVYRRQAESICVEYVVTEGDWDVLIDFVILRCKLTWIYRRILLDNSIQVVILNNFSFFVNSYCVASL